MLIPEVDSWVVVPIVHRIQWGVMDMPVTGARQDSGLHTVHSFIFRPIHCLPSADQPVSSMKKGKTIYSSFCQYSLNKDPDPAFQNAACCKNISTFL
jgi:hypothetical protein